MGRGAPSNSCELFHLHIHEVTERESLGNKVYFETGSDDIMDESQPLLTSLAALAVRHQEIELRVEGHTSERAPESMAICMTQSRARQVKAELMQRGVDPSRVATNGWGKEVAQHAPWAPGKETRMAEVYVSHKGVQFPPRPEWYLRATLPTDDRRSLSWQAVWRLFDAFPDDMDDSELEFGDPFGDLGGAQGT